MKIKTKKRVNIPELIKYAWENDVREKWFYSDNQAQKSSYGVEFDEDGDFISRVALNSDLLFTVEVEEEITKDTEFKTLIEVTEIQNVFTHINTSINEINHDTVVEIHALINGRLTLIWRDGKLVE